MIWLEIAGRWFRVACLWIIGGFLPPARQCDFCLYQRGMAEDIFMREDVTGRVLLCMKPELRPETGPDRAPFCVTVNAFNHCGAMRYRGPIKEEGEKS